MIVSAGYRRFARRVSEARNGTGILLPVLTELNITVANKPTLDIYDEFIIKLDAIGNVSQQLSYAMKAMDSDGVALVTQ